MELFKDKTKRIAHQPKYDISKLPRVKDRTKIGVKAELSNGDNSKGHKPTKVVVSGEVYIGNVLSKAKFRRLLRESQLENNGVNGQVSKGMDGVARNGKSCVARRRLNGVARNGINSDSSEDEMNERVPHRMELRKRNRSFVYEERYFVDQYLTRAHYNWLEEESKREANLVRRRVKSSGSLSSLSTTTSSLSTRTSSLSTTSEVLINSTLKRESGRSLQWDKYLQDSDRLSQVAPVELFKQAPLENVWSSFAKVGLAVELRNPFAECDVDAYWMGKIVHYAGYLALVQLENSPLNSPEYENYLCWISFCSDVPKPVGWCFKNRKLLLPVTCSDIPTVESDDALRTFYDNPTITDNHLESLRQNMKRAYRVNSAIPVEAEDPEAPGEIRLARIVAKTTNRVQLLYDNRVSRWVNLKQDVFPFGWSHTVGIQMKGNFQNFVRTALDPILLPALIENVDVHVGMKVETRHPKLKHKIVGAVVTKTLNYQYFVIETMERSPETRVKQFHHITSPFIFPWGWARKWGIPLDSEVLDENLPTIAVGNLPTRSPHSFLTGMKLEAVISEDENQFCVPATVEKIADHMLLIHFLGTEFEDINTKWVDAEQSDIFPVGYAELVGIRFEGKV